MTDSELKVGMQGTWGDGAFICTLVAGPDTNGWYVVATPRGEYQTVMDFVPDPAPPSTVKVEMSVELAQEWAHMEDDGILLAVWSSTIKDTKTAAAAALRAEGLE